MQQLVERGGVWWGRVWGGGVVTDALANAILDLVRPELQRMVEDVVSKRLPAPKKWLTTASAAEYLSISPAAVRQRVRANRIPMRQLLVAVVLASLLTAASAQPVRRNIPVDSQLGTITAASASRLEIDGKVYQLAPGTRILNQRNLTVTPNMVPKDARARFTLDAGGQIRAVWLVDSDDLPSAGPVQRAPGTN